MRPPRRDRLATWAAVATFSVVLSPPPSGGAQQPLTSLVSANVGLVIEVRGLAEQIEAFSAGPTFRRIAHYPPFERWTKENGHIWNAVSNESLQRLGAVPADIVSNLLGNEVLFAVWPPEGDSGHGTETGQGDALLLVRANDGALLQTVLDRLIAVHRESGRWKRQQSFEQSGRTFEFNEIETSHDQPRLFLAVAERLGVVSTSQRLIRETLAREVGPDSRPGTLAAMPAYRAAAARLTPDSVARLFVNPRAWDGPLAADLRKKQPGSDEAQTQAVIVATWRAMEYLAAGFEFAPRLSLEGFVRWDHAALPDAVREAADCLGGPAEFIQRVPADAMVTLVGRVDLGRLLARFGVPQSDAARAPPAVPPEVSSASGVTTGPSTPGDIHAVAPRSTAFDPGWFAVQTLAGGLGADFGAYLVPRRGSGSDESPDVLRVALPFDGVVAFRTTSLEPGDERPVLAELIEPVLHRALMVAVKAHNAQQQGPLAEVRSLEIAGVRLTSVVGLVAFPRGLEAAYAVVDRCLLAGTSPEAVQQAALPAEGASLAGSPQFTARLGPRLANPSQLLYVDLAAVRRMLAGSPEALDFLAAVKGLDRPAAERSARELISLLQLTDALIAAVKVDDQGVTAGISLIADEEE